MPSSQAEDYFFDDSNEQVRLQPRHDAQQLLRRKRVGRMPPIQTSLKRTNRPGSMRRSMHQACPPGALAHRSMRADDSASVSALSKRGVRHTDGETHVQRSQPDADGVVARQRRHIGERVHAPVAVPGS